MRQTAADEQSSRTKLSELEESLAALKGTPLVAAWPVFTLLPRTLRRRNARQPQLHNCHGRRPAVYRRQPARTTTNAPLLAEAQLPRSWLDDRAPAGRHQLPSAPLGTIRRPLPIAGPSADEVQTACSQQGLRRRTQAPYRPPLTTRCLMPAAAAHLLLVAGRSQQLLAPARPTGCCHQPAPQGLPHIACSSEPPPTPLSAPCCLSPAATRHLLLQLATQSPAAAAKQQTACYLHRLPHVQLLTGGSYLPAQPLSLSPSLSLSDLPPAP